ncbi:hypothetical protein FG379_000457 [Cryptosporidium bovis]|uniref:uncharacterized protein n=1 Tax=Cryptosporidium bovis TaxID=310047 RepID=UPI00351A21A9|nr:hypothetical protein FG379_000457 [Cryptosporidium bovis]
MESFDDEFYDGRVNSELEGGESFEIEDFGDNTGRLRIRGDLNLPEKYIGEKISSLEYKNSRNKELMIPRGGKLSDSKSKKRGESNKFVHNFEYECISELEEESEKNSKAKIQLSDSITRRVNKYKEAEMNFSIIDDNKMRNKRINDEERGKTIKNQRKIWADILAIRIFIHDVLKYANRIPPSEMIPFLDDESIYELNEIRREIVELLLMIHDAQIGLFSKFNNSKLQHYLNNGDFLSEIFDDDINVDDGEEGERNSNKRLHSEMRFWELYSPLMDKSLEWCIDVSDKWKKETQIEVQRNFKVLDQSIRNQLKQTLLNKEHSLNKSRPNANSMDFIGSKILKNHLGEKEIQELNKGIYDDSVSFASLLKDIISDGIPNSDEKLNSISSSLVSRSKRTVNNVDRRASKGRKIRYVPIPKLENFMASIPSAYSDSILPGANNEEFVDCIMRSLLLA